MDSRPLVVDRIATGSRGTVARSRVADNLDVLDLPVPERHAAIILRQAAEHLSSERGLGPVPWGAEPVHAGSCGTALRPQERALTSATAYRLGVGAVGADWDLVQWVVLAGRGVRAFERHKGWRNGRAKSVLLEVLARLAEVYGT